MSDRSGVIYQKGKPPLRRGAGRGAYSKHLALRNDKGQFQKVPRRDLEIILYCGTVRGANRIISENIRAVKTGIERGIVGAMIEMIPKTAKRTGKMRSILQVTAQQVARTRTTTAADRIVIDLNEIKEIAAAIEMYIRLHINPGSAFGRAYQEPFTKGTMPFDLIELQAKVNINVNQEVRSAQIRAGLAIR